MDSKTIFKVLSFVGMALGGIGTLLSAWADGIRGHGSLRAPQKLHLLLWRIYI